MGDKKIQAPVTDIQRFSIHDGPGIRTLVFFKGCPLQCAWCQNPETQNPKPVIAFYESRCQLSGQCLPGCLEGAIRRTGFRIDYDKCTVCGNCVKVCPNGALQQIGTLFTPEELMPRLLADLSYYRSSGNGGVTFSGGEAALYPAFMDQLLDLCQSHEIHTTMETCGVFRWERWQSILTKLNLIYFDLKIMDPVAHKNFTGKENDSILANAEKMVAWHLPVEFRMPLVQGFTDHNKNIRAVIQWLKKRNILSIHLLKYHNMGESKIDIIQGRQKKIGLTNYPEEKFVNITGYFEDNGIQVLSH